MNPHEQKADASRHGSLALEGSPISFEVEDVQLRVEAKFGVQPVRSIWWRLRLTRQLFLSDDYTLKGCLWTLIIRESEESAVAPDLEAIGIIDYLKWHEFPSPERPACEANVFLPPTSFSTALSAINKGRTPMQLTLYIWGMTFCRVEDLFWDVNAIPNPCVVSLSFNAPIIVRQSVNVTGELSNNPRWQLGGDWLALAAIILMALVTPPISYALALVACVIVVANAIRRNKPHETQK